MDRRIVSRRGFFGRMGLLAAVVLSCGWLSPAAARADDIDIDYVPPVKDAPAKRQSGASRGGPTESGPRVHVCVLAPADRVGQTTQAQPKLFWSIDQPVKHAIELTILPFDPANPAKPFPTLLDVNLKGPHEPGLHVLDLSQPGGGAQPVKLEPGKRYKWVIEVVSRETNGSANPSASCFVQCVAAPDDLQRKIKDASPAQQAAAFAKAGVWFDAIASLNQAMDAAKADPDQLKKLHAARKKLLAAQRLDEDDSGHISERAAATGNTK